MNSRFCHQLKVHAGIGSTNLGFNFDPTLLTVKTSYVLLSTPQYLFTREIMVKLRYEGCFKSPADLSRAVSTSRSVYIFFSTIE